jgi:abhydrolase domain-containing protein 17
MIDSYLDMSYNCKINVLGYDYSGYGCSGKKRGVSENFRITDFSIIEDIKSVYLFARHSLGFKASKIILYGQSLGSGPSIFLAGLKDYPVGGVVIHSAYSSGLKVIFP